MLALDSEQPVHDVKTMQDVVAASVATRRLAMYLFGVFAGFALLLCDMDNLKTVNDTRGHDAGDKALQRLADALRSQLRRTDDAYRIGGDEFAIVLPRASRLDAERVMRRLRDGLSATVDGGHAIEASFCLPQRGT